LDNASKTLSSQLGKGLLASEQDLIRCNNKENRIYIYYVQPQFCSEGAE